VPGDLPVSASTSSTQGEVTGFVVLTKGSDSRRIPFWLRVSSPQLPRVHHGRLSRTGTYRGNTRGRPALVDSYRYPDNPSGVGVPTNLRGPEQAFTVRLRKNVANFGVAIIGHARGVSIQPRVVAGDDEDRLTGYPALPLNLNPYLVTFFQRVSAAGAILPAKGTYTVIFDSTSKSNAGRFTFRFWINDTRPPTARLLTRTISFGGALRMRLTDAGSGIDPTSLVARVDGNRVSAAYSRAKRRATIRPGALTPGRHKLVFQASDYQESRNMEDVGPILPNTRVLTTTFRVR